MQGRYPGEEILLERNHQYALEPPHQNGFLVEDCSYHLMLVGVHVSGVEAQQLPTEWWGRTWFLRHTFAGGETFKLLICTSNEKI